MNHLHFSLTIRSNCSNWCPRVLKGLCCFNCVDPGDESSSEEEENNVVTCENNDLVQKAIKDVKKTQDNTNT